MNNAIVIIPTYKERENIRAIIDTVFGLPKDFHILIVDDNSPDGTPEIVEQMQQEHNEKEVKLHMVRRTGKLGLGTAYITGFKYAIEKGYDYILEMDADFSHDPKDLVNLYLTCSERGGDVAIGSRYATGVNVVNWPIGRVLAFLFREQLRQTHYKHANTRYHGWLFMLSAEGARNDPPGQDQVCRICVSNRDEISRVEVRLYIARSTHHFYGADAWRI